MKISELVYWDGEYVDFGLITPTYEQKKRMRPVCDFCDELAEYHVEIGEINNPYQYEGDYSYHNVCRKHLRIKSLNTFILEDWWKNYFKY